MTNEFWITIIAIVIGPLIAVLLSIELQRRNERNSLKMRVYRSLMATRRTTLSPQRIEALNLVDVEFSKSPKVIQEFKKLIAIYNDQARWKSNEESVGKKVIQDVEDKTADLLRVMGRELGFPYESLDLLRGGYYPEALSNIEQQQHDAREFLASLNRGTRALPVIVVSPTSGEDAKDSAQ